MRKPRVCGPSYVANLGQSGWRVVVPVPGKLTPLVCRETFQTRAQAQAWLSSAEGQSAIRDLTPD